MLIKELNIQKKNNLLTILILILLAFVIRMTAGYLMRDSYFSRGNRFSVINPISLNIIQKGEFSVTPGSPTATSEPLYPFFIALAYSVFGYNWIGPAIFQSLISLLNGVLIYYISRTIFMNDKIALTSFTLVLFYPFLLLQSISISDTVFFCFWLALSVALTLISNRSCNYITYIFCGISWGLTMLTRLSAISLFPFSLIFLYLFSKNEKRIKRIILISLFCFLTLSPWAIRNYLHSGKLMISSHGAVEVWLGFNQETREILKNNISVDKMKKNLTKIPEITNINNRLYNKLILKEYDESKVYLKEAFQFLKQDPFWVFKMMPLKFEKFWSWNYNPVPTSNNYLQDRYRRMIYTLSYLPILLLGIFGAILNKNKNKDHLLLILLIFGYTMMHSIIYGFTRLRIPLDQFIIIYASVAMELISIKFQKQNG